MKKMIFNFKILSLILFFGIFASCNKENADLQFDGQEEILTEDLNFDMVQITNSFAGLDQIPEIDEEAEMLTIDGKPKCFKLVYPVDIMFPDSSVVTVNSREEFKNAVKNWHENNPGVQGRAKIIFPVDVILKSGKRLTVNSRIEFIKLIRKCKKLRKPLNICFKPLFPLTLVYPDGSTVEYDSAKEMMKALIEWKKNNPGSNARPVIQFPFDVKLKNGKIITIKNKNDLKKLLIKCRKYKRRH